MKRRLCSPDLHNLKLRLRHGGRRSPLCQLETSLLFDAMDQVPQTALDEQLFDFFKFGACRSGRTQIVARWRVKLSGSVLDLESVVMLSFLQVEQQQRALKRDQL